MISLRTVFLMCVILERAESFEQNSTLCTIGRARPRSFFSVILHIAVQCLHNSEVIPLCFFVHMGSINCHSYSCLVSHYNTLTALSQM